jgi:hypothetical protein
LNLTTATVASAATPPTLAGSAAWREKVAASVRPDETTLANYGAARASGPTATATTGNHQRPVIGTDDKTAPTAATANTTPVTAHSADCNLQDLTCGQAEVAADFGTLAASTENPGKEAAASALCAKGEDLIGVGSRHSESDEASGISEVDRIGASGQIRRCEPQNRCPSQHKLFHIPSPESEFTSSLLNSRTMLRATRKVNLKIRLIYLVNIH